jgi:hypothetical protein
VAPRQKEQMTFTSPKQLTAVGLGIAVLAYFGARVGYGSLPPLPVLAGATLLLVAVIDMVLALTMGPRAQRKPGTEPLEALTAARAVALAKASSAAGAIMAGLWLGFLAYLLPLRAVVEAARSDTTASLVGLVSAVALIGAGLWLENALRNPDEPDELDDE